MSTRAKRALRWLLLVLALLAVPLAVNVAGPAEARGPGLDGQMSGAAGKEPA